MYWLHVSKSQGLQWQPALHIFETMPQHDAGLNVGWLSTLHASELHLLRFFLTVVG